MKDIARVLNVIAAGMCFVTYMRRRIEFGEWRICWFMAVLSAVNLWAALYLY